MNRSSKHFNAGSSLATNRMAGCLLSAAKAEPRCASIGYKPPAPEVFVPTFVALARLLSNLVRHCLLPSSCWSPRWCLLPSASGLTEEVFPRTAIELIELLAVQLIISTRQSQFGN